VPRFQGRIAVSNPPRPSAINAAPIAELPVTGVCKPAAAPVGAAPADEGPASVTVAVVVAGLLD